jgi:hypothetical protein
VTGKKAADKEGENEEVAEAVEEGEKVSEGGNEAVTEEQKEKEGEGEEKDLTLSDTKVNRKSTVHPVDPVLDRALFDR